MKRVLVLALFLMPIPAGAQSGSEAEPTRGTASVAEGQPRYLAAMRDELRAMNLAQIECEVLDDARARCSFVARGVSTSREFTIRMVYSDRTDTIYMHIERYLVAPDDRPATVTLLRRLMELNWQLLLGKFEWDSTDGEVRLAMILNTDSNFDRRAFRSAARGITALADRFYGELDRLNRH